MTTINIENLFLDFLHKTEISAILADFCVNLVVITTPFAFLKITIVSYHSLEYFQYLYTTEIVCIFAYFA